VCLFLIKPLIVYGLEVQKLGDSPVYLVCTFSRNVKNTIHSKGIDQLAMACLS